MRLGTSQLARVLRRWRLDRNPLRRGSDRGETVVLSALLAAFLTAVPFAGHAAGSWAHHTFAREAQAQRAVVHPVRATLLQAPTSVISYPGAGAGPLGYAAAGSTVPMWVDRTGEPADPPLGRAQVASRAELARELTVAALAIVLAVSIWLTRRTLDRRRMAAWDADWRATGPRWSPRH